jgi:hypothetical protein
MKVKSRSAAAQMKFARRPERYTRKDYKWIQVILNGLMKYIRHVDKIYHRQTGSTVSFIVLTDRNKKPRERTRLLWLNLFNMFNIWFKS